MPSRQISETSADILRQYHRIGLTEYRQLVRFVDLQSDHIAQLDDDDQLNIYCSYAEALFAIGEYRAHIAAAKSCIERSFTTNISNWYEYDILELMLFKMAAAYYNTGQLTLAKKHVLSLMRIAPQEKQYRAFYLHILRSETPGYTKQLQRFTVLTALTAALVIALEILAVQPFYPALQTTTSTTGRILLAVSVVSAIGGEVYKYLSSWYHVKRLIEEIVAEKS
jgi:tetratricopeptide (TPR) repeat protein